MSRPATLPPREDGFRRKAWSVSECRLLVDAGLLEAGKFELIEGEIVDKRGQDRAHICVVSHVLSALSPCFGPHSIQTHAQIGIGEIEEFNDPEPDVAVLLGTLVDYIEREPHPATEVLLAVEVSNTTLAGDTTTKAAIYARNGIAEYWVVAIPTRTLIVHRQPSAEGYTDVRAYDEGESVSPLAAPDAPVRVADLLP